MKKTCHICGHGPGSEYMQVYRGSTVCSSVLCHGEVDKQREGIMKPKKPDISWTNEELIQWAFIHGPIAEEDIRHAFKGIELHCAQHPIALHNFIEQLVNLTLKGITFREAVELIKERSQ